MAAQRQTDGYLLDLYRRYIGEPDGRTDVYLGFGLFLGGIGLAIVALGLFVYSSTLKSQSNDLYYTWVEPAYALGMLSLPATMLGIVVLLPSERRVLYTSIVGTVVTTAAVGGFVYSYPADWNFYGENYTVQVVGVYAVGLAGLSASTGAALIAHYLDLARAVESTELEDDEDEEHYTDDEIRSDIDDAMEGVELSWGGVEKTEHKRLSFTDHEFDGAKLELGTKTTRSSGVDEQINKLKGLKGGDTKTTTSSTTVDEQTAKLKELREQKAREEAERAGEAGPLNAITAPFARLKTRVFAARSSTGVVQRVRDRVKRD